MPISLLKKFLKLESASGLILLGAAFFAMIWANSLKAPLYHQLLNVSLFWINEGLMAVFFLLVGLELKRGFLRGELSQFSQIALPAAGALGGMLVPAGIFWLINHHNPLIVKGWAIPVATDIAFALGVVSLFGKKIPSTLKLFLLALAIFDDIGAIIIIALFYSDNIAYLALFQSIVLMSILYFFNRLNIMRVWPYLFIGAWLWLCLLPSGIHPTIAGVMTALFIPGGESHSPLQRLETRLHPWVAFFIMPLFALANAGFSLKEVTLQSFGDPIVLGIILGLFLGKQIGVFSFSWGFIKLGLAKLPDKSTWLDLYGIAIVCGIGFTMSLFLGTLAFKNESFYLAEVRLGVMIGSILSGILGAVVLLIAFARRRSSIVD